MFLFLFLYQCFHSQELKIVLEESVTSTERQQFNFSQSGRLLLQDGKRTTRKLIRCNWPSLQLHTSDFDLFENLNQNNIKNGTI